MELGGAGWSWVELGARFSNTHTTKQSSGVFDFFQLKLLSTSNRRGAGEIVLRSKSLPE